MRRPKPAFAPVKPKVTVGLFLVHPIQTGSEKLRFPWQPPDPHVHGLCQMCLPRGSGTLAAMPGPRPQSVLLRPLRPPALCLLGCRLPCSGLCPTRPLSQRRYRRQCDWVTPRLKTSEPPLPTRYSPNHAPWTPAAPGSVPQPGPRGPVLHNSGRVGPVHDARGRPSPSPALLTRQRSGIS